MAAPKMNDLSETSTIPTIATELEDEYSRLLAREHFDWFEDVEQSIAMEVESHATSSPIPIPAPTQEDEYFYLPDPDYFDLCDDIEETIAMETESHATSSAVPISAIEKDDEYLYLPDPESFDLCDDIEEDIAVDGEAVDTEDIETNLGTAQCDKEYQYRSYVGGQDGTIHHWNLFGQLQWEVMQLATELLQLGHMAEYWFWSPTNLFVPPRKLTSKVSHSKLNIECMSSTMENPAPSNRLYTYALVPIYLIGKFTKKALLMAKGIGHALIKCRVGIMEALKNNPRPSGPNIPRKPFCSLSVLVSEAVFSIVKLRQLFIWILIEYLNTVSYEGDTVSAALPQLLQGPHQTRSSALQKVRFVGPMREWEGFFDEVLFKIAAQKWSKKVVAYTLSKRDLQEEKVFVGDENGLRGRFQQSVGQVVGAALEA
ncbi:uncharacterized protein PGRI_013990 [Penicillium griseofulvum]|uniref:Uncharacterized protein n=1 Tax=Penicillium patulum TaxID=5078 RepID=A0A135LF01_PENPA|nr:uncharacterized protein PGRI_013990 [Penicillium griseofulvum]KXG47529.1 hypothetical protein PGRI_013990 [Penicillium griseofulvum]